MTTDTELRALAEKAKAAGHWHKVHPANQRYIYDFENALKALHEAANPQAILSLLDRVEKAEGAASPITGLEVEDIRNNEALDCSDFDYVTICLERPQREETGVIGSEELARIYNLLTNARAALPKPESER